MKFNKVLKNLSTYEAGKPIELDWVKSYFSF